MSDSPDEVLLTLEDIAIIEWVCNRAHTLNGVIQSLGLPDNVEELHRLTGLMLKLNEAKKKLKAATKEA